MWLWWYSKSLKKGHWGVQICSVFKCSGNASSLIGRYIKVSDGLHVADSPATGKKCNDS